MGQLIKCSTKVLFESSCLLPHFGRLKSFELVVSCALTRLECILCIETMQDICILAKSYTYDVRLLLFL